MSAPERAGGWGGRRSLWLIAIVVALILVLVAVVRAFETPRGGVVPGMDTTARDLVRLRGTWTLTQLTVDGRDADLGLVDAIDLSLDLTSLQGWNGCQAYATIYTATASGAFSTQPLGLSEDTCQGESAEVAATYLTAFSAAERWSLADDGALHLRGLGVTLVYSRAVEPSPSPEELASAPWVGTWQVRSLHTPTDDLTLDTDEDVWIGLGTITATGQAGCNAFFGRVTTLGARGLEFEHLVIGLKDCLAPQGVMRHESELMDILASVERWNVDDQGLLHLTGHSRTVILERSGPPPLLDTLKPV
jgi:heat shock protein HslJ